MSRVDFKEEYSWDATVCDSYNCVNATVLNGFHHEIQLCKHIPSLKCDTNVPCATVHLPSSAGNSMPSFFTLRYNVSGCDIQGKTLGLLCSVKCPGDLALNTYDTARALRDAGVTVIGGFHLPMEKEYLDLLLRGKQTVVVCPARSIQDMCVPAEWRAPIADGRLLLISPFDSNVRRATKDTARQRNAFIGRRSRVLVAAKSLRPARCSTRSNPPPTFISWPSARGRLSCCARTSRAIECFQLL